MAALTEPGRIACCIVGCRRTFRADALGDDHSEVMCGKHFRVEPKLVRQLKAVRIRIRRVNTFGRRLQRRQGGGLTDAQLARLDRVWEKLAARDRMLWTMIAAIAQQRQNEGFWAPRPRGMSRKPPSDEGEKTNKQHAERFEDQFQRLKRAHGLDRESP